MNACISNILDISRPVFIRVDLNNSHIVGELFQIFANDEIILSHIARSLFNFEQNLSVFQKEIAAIIWVVEQFSEVLSGVEYTVITENQIINNFISGNLQ
jgi:hypothetical protein